MISYHDVSVINQLLRDSEEPKPSIIWQRKDNNTLFADVCKLSTTVHVEVSNSSGERVTINFSSPGLGEVQIMEPMQSTFSIGKKYDTPEETELATTMNRLLAVASRQNKAREQRDEETKEERKQSIFRCLMNGLD